MKHSCVDVMVSIFMYFCGLDICGSIPAAARSKAWVCGRLLAGIAGSNPAGAWMSLVNVVFCQVEISASG